MIKNDLNFIQPGDINEKFLIDTNVLLKVLEYPDLFREGCDYDIFWDYAITNNLQMFVTPLTISEFINVICRIEYKNYLDEHDFKKSDYSFKNHYQQSEDFQIIYDYCLAIVETDILPNVEIINSNKDSMISLSNHCRIMKDYNDLIYFSLARENGLSIVTHDGDFLNIEENIKIYTYL